MKEYGPGMLSGAANVTNLLERFVGVTAATIITMMQKEMLKVETQFKDCAVLYTARPAQDVVGEEAIMVAHGLNIQL